MLKLLKYLKPFKKTAILCVFLVLASNGMHLISPLFSRTLVTVLKVVNEGADSVKSVIPILKYFPDMPFLDNFRAEDYVLVICLALLFLQAVSGGISIWNSYCTSKTSAGYALLLRKAMFHKVQQLSQSDIDKIGVPSMITRTSGDIRNIQDMVLSALRIIVPAPVMLVGGIAMAVAMNPELAKILLVIIPIIVVIVLIVAKFAIPIFKKLQRLTDALNQVMREKLSGIRVIKAFNRTEYEDGRFKATNFELTSITLKVQRIFAAFMPVAILAGFSLMLFIMWKMGIKLNALDPAIDSEKLEIVQTLGNTTAFITYIAIVISAVSMAAGMFIQIPKAAISAKRLREVFDMVPDIKESETPIEFNRDKRGDLDFKNVCFKYPGEEKSILSDISFSSKKGEITAIIGGTGSGKTTLISLIPRLYDITEGEIYLGGVSIRDIPLKTLHSKIAYIPQKAFLFSGTIADNLRYGKEDATEYEMDKALEIAQAKNFVMKMEEGKESLVSQSGANLSGGQRQRLAIARAIIKKSDICIFDDSFSALDLATDSRLRAAIRENLADTNVIIVAQRVGTVLDADRIIVMDGGRAVGMGKHRDLIETCGVYREIVSSQLSEEALL